MKQFSSQFKKQSESIRMRASEKRELKERLVAYMEYHPLPKEMKLPAKRKSLTALKGIPSELFFSIPFTTKYLRNFSGVFAVLCILSVPLIAEKALPGDVLYPVKVQFTEELRSTLSFSPYAKVAWETQRLERRISEARLLASEGKLTAEAQSQFAEAIKTHADAAQHEIAILRKTDTDKAALAEITFASALAVQSQVLEGHMQNGSKEVATDNHSILAVAEVVAQARTSAEVAQKDAPLSYEGLRAAVELDSTRVYELLASIKTTAAPDVITDVERRLTDVERKIAQANAIKEGAPTQEDAEIASATTLLSEGSTTQQHVQITSLATTEIAKMAKTGTTSTEATATLPSIQTLATTSKEIVDTVANQKEATVLLRATLGDIQKLINYLTHLDVREAISVETLVPVTPTTKERANEIKATFDDTNKTVADIKLRFVDSKLRSKVSHGQAEIQKKLSETTKAMSLGNLNNARSSINEAHAMARDVSKLVSQEPLRENEKNQTTTEATTTLPVASSTAKILSQ